MTTTVPTPEPSHGIMLIPSDRFFVRRISLSEDSDAESQVEMTLEGSSPFPLEQLHHGFLLSPSRREALVYAAYRKHLPAQLYPGWDSAEAIVPEFIALLGRTSATPLIRCWHREGRVTAVAWDGAGQLPTAILSRDGGDRARRHLVEMLQARLRRDDVPVEDLGGKIEIGREARSGLFSLTVENPGAETRQHLAAPSLQTMDLREKEFMRARRREARRDQALARGFRAVAAAVAAVLVIEVALTAADHGVARAEARVAQNAPAIAKIEASQSLVARAEELAKRRLRPFEMLDLLNQNRPASVLFLRASTPERYALEVEAQTPRADDVSRYEAALGKSAEVTKLDVRDLRSRDGITTFILAVTFRPDAFTATDSP